MSINPISENEVGAAEVPDNGLTQEQINLINEQVRLGEELVQPPVEPSTEGTETLLKLHLLNLRNSQNNLKNLSNLKRNSKVYNQLLIYLTI